MKTKQSVSSRFWSKVAIGLHAECWPWQAFCDKDGYGRFSIGAKDMSAQRAAWELSCGPIENGAQVLHKCDNPQCCNPAHLFLGSHADNMKDAASKGRMRGSPQLKGAASPKRQMTHCKFGHIYDDANTGWSKAGHRVCRHCSRLATARNRLKKRGPKTEPTVHYNKAKTQCVHGHPFNEQNTYWFRGYRQCRTCSKNRIRKSR